MKRLREKRGTEQARHTSLKPAAPKIRRSHRRGILIGLSIFIVLLAIGRAMLPSFVRDYVNRTLDRNQAYSGTIGKVQIHLWRGAYSIHEIRISKKSGNVPVPFFSASTVDFSIQWNALAHRKIVGRVVVQDPEMNFVDGGDKSDSQTGAGGPWLQMIRDLFPFKINSALIRNGTVHFRAMEKKEPVDVYLSQLEASIDNLSNIQDETNPLISKVKATALAMGQAKLEYNMSFDPFSYRPTFHMGMRLLGLDVTKINNLARSYGKFDFERGWFDLVIETDSKEGQITGYAKPLFRNLKVFSLINDLKDENALEYFWQALVGAVTTALKNQPRDQFGTRIPFRVEVAAGTRVDLLTTIGNILRNAFIRAYLPRLDNPQQFEGMEFGAPELIESLSTSNGE
jgi:hypothetical protein